MCTKSLVHLWFPNGVKMVHRRAEETDQQVKEAVLVADGQMYKEAALCSGYWCSMQQKKSHAAVLPIRPSEHWEKSQWCSWKCNSFEIM